MHWMYCFWLLNPHFLESSGGGSEQSGVWNLGSRSPMVSNPDSATYQ